jgi:hypothetical protein
MKVLFLTNEVDLDAKGGGAQRSKILIEAIKDSLPTSSTLSLRQISFFEFKRLQTSEVFDLPVAHDIEFAINLRETLKINPNSLNSLTKEIEESDYVFVDNCYLAPLIEHLAISGRGDHRIIYISHNYERSLKETTSSILKWPDGSARKYLDKVAEFESLLWTVSTARVVCSLDDASNLNQEYFRDFIYVPNGGHSRKPPTDSENSILTYLGCESYSLFVASGHPPNIDGFLNGIGPDFGFVPLSSRIVLVGSATGPIQEKIVGTKFHETFLKNGSAIIEASDQLLDNLYAYASNVVLPIFKGSGTSIKSIEALLTGKKLIATEYAFRGIDVSQSSENQITFCETQYDFKAAISKSLLGPRVSFETSGCSLELEWSKIRAQATNDFKKIFGISEKNQ